MSAPCELHPGPRSGALVLGLARLYWALGAAGEDVSEAWLLCAAAVGYGPRQRAVFSIPTLPRAGAALP
jgi:hypothetical protein